ncbi:TIGR01457 family HAD-type hydrolase [Halobacillus sp. KGW1]|uniref:TIGR01457 family HAD-type hydrolase n=1 Tax=Halobacillus sp. KGW1 TaxID=1793726 RepID=UPI000780F99C|nr:TIGR01457 family HAD-type hydrolase [Halobacillus sp. KGW1]
MYRDYKAYLIDLDGTMYKGTDKIDGAGEFVQALVDKERPFLFLTNNSSKRVEQVAAKLTDLGIPANPDQVYTSSIATAEYIKSENHQARVFVIGEDGLLDALDREGLTRVESRSDYVVIGIDREITYEKLARACLEVRNGAKLISTNGDIAIPTERGMLPGNGALTSVVAVSTGVDPVFVGKPESLIMDRALKRIGFGKDEVLMVGDNYNTDILAGIRAGIDTLMVETGVSSFDELKQTDPAPTYKCRDLYEWMKG